MTCKRCDVINITWRKNNFLKQVQPNQWCHRDGELRSFSLFTWHEWVMCKEATDKSAQVLIRKNWTKIILHPVTSRSRTLAIGFTVQRVSQPATNSRRSKTNMHLHGQAFGRTQVVCPMAGSTAGKKCLFWLHISIARNRYIRICICTDITSQLQTQPHYTDKSTDARVCCMWSGGQDLYFSRIMLI